MAGAVEFWGGARGGVAKAGGAGELLLEWSPPWYCVRWAFKEDAVL